MTEPTLQSLREARDALDVVIVEIRQVPGFESFLTSPGFDDVERAAAEHPVVYLVAAEFGGLALVVRGEEVTDIDLPDLTRDMVAARAKAHVEAHEAYRADRDAGSWEDALLEVTGWLWTAAMGPVVADLLGPQPVVGVETPRVYLVAGGLLGLLPLHAAWRSDPSRPTAREHVLDLLRVAYVPNARALSAARNVAASVLGRRVYAVATPPRTSGLPMPGVEARAAGLAFSGGHVDRYPTADGFLDRIREADVLHVACHGQADLEEPLRSRLTLAPDQEVTLETLLNLPPDALNVRLAVLSACETLLPGTELPDEVVALPTGLIQAGAAGVIASMWLVPDLESALLMIEFYRFWRERPDDPGGALRQAQIWLRDTSAPDRLRHYRAAAQGAGWPSRKIADEVLDALATAPAAGAEGPVDRISGWAAFAHVGV